MKYVHPSFVKNHLPDLMLLDEFAGFGKYLLKFLK
jgi:hypothetical protein